MKINELKDEEILNFLMVSDFEQPFSPEELKYLLVKWRYFYRLFQGRNEQTRMKLEDDIKKLQDELDVKKQNEFDLQVKVAKKDDLIATMKSRKLSFKERWLGKIIFTEDENK